MKRVRGSLIWLGSIVMFVASLSHASADERIFRPAYDCIDDDGRLVRVLKIGEIGAGNVIYPLLLTFCPAKASENTLLGPGWEIPVFDAKLVQVAENEFSALLPNAKTVLLRRQKDPNKLFHPSGWTGEVGRDSTTIKSPEGSIYTYRGGRLSAFTPPAGDPFEIKRSKDSSKVVNSTTQRVLLEIAPVKGKEDTFRADLAGKEMFLTTTKRPLIRSSGTQYLINGMIPALKEVVCDGVSMFSAEYDVTADILPRATIVSANKPLSEAIWNPDTGLLMKENGWSYTFKRPNIVSSYEITRENDEGLSEVIAYNPMLSSNRIEDLLGGVATFSAYPASLKVDAPRKVMVSRNGKNDVFYRSFINEKGHLLRETTQSASGPIETAYDYGKNEGDFVKTVSQNNVVLLKEEYKEGILISTTAGKWKITRDAKGELMISAE